MVPRPQGAVVPQTSGMVAPVTGDNNLAIRRSEIKQGIREVVLCKDGKGKVGLRVRDINKGVFVQYVHANSPAALGGLRFGDQILQIDGETLAGYSSDKVMKILKNASAQRVVFAVRDRLEVHLCFKCIISTLNCTYLCICKPACIGFHGITCRITLHVELSNPQIIIIIIIIIISSNFVLGYIRPQATRCNASNMLFSTLHFSSEQFALGSWAAITQ